VITSTGAKEFVLTRSMVEKASKSRSGRPMALIDIAVPRDVEPTVGQLSNVYLYDIDDLEGVIAANLAERERQVTVVDRLIEEALFEYSKWLAEQDVVPLIAALRDKGTEIQTSVMTSLQRKLPDLTEHELQLIQKHTMSIVNQLLRDPILNMKELAIASGGSKHVRIFAELFGIPEARLSEVQRGWLGESDEVLWTAASGTRFADLVRQWSENLMHDRVPEGPGKATLHPVLW